MATQADLPMVPELVSKTLNRLDESVILHRNGKFYFANDAALRLLGFDDMAALAARTDLLDQLAGGSQQAQIADTDGAMKDVTVTTGTFPWHDGPLVKSSLRPAGAAPVEPAPVTRQPEEPAPAKPASAIPATKSPVAEPPAPHRPYSAGQP